jgi:pimeloyl-ACP methyl ester carboxylesterase
VLAAGLLLAGCASDDDADPPSTSTSEDSSSGSTSGSTTGDGTTTTGDVELPEVEEFTGTVDDFYRVPDPLPEGPPGALIRVQPVDEADGFVTVRVMYHSRDAEDVDRAVTGLVTYPEGEPPADGWPVVAWAHGTTGLASICAPSRGGGPPPAFGVDGVRVASDYIGLGPIGERHPYLSGPSEGHSVIDGVRAARQLLEGHVGERWVAAGHSQGGHAALFTNELAEAYAPELELLGTAAVAPAAVFDRTFGPNDQIVPRMVGLLALYGAEAEHPEIDADDYVSDELAAVAGAVDEGCLQDAVDAFLTVPLDRHFDVDPLATEPARSMFLANDPGQVAVDAPLLVVQGLEDALVVPARVDALVEKLCAVGQVAELLSVPASHDTVVGQAAAQIEAFFADRFAGEPPVDSCPPA